MRIITHCILLIITAIFAIVFLDGCAKAEVNLNGGDYSIYGNLTYPDGITGIPNITISIKGENVSMSDKSDAFGSYQISGLPTGSYIIEIGQTSELTGFSANVSIAQANKEFNMMIGKRFFDYYDPFYYDNSLYGFKLDPYTMHIGSNFHLIEYISVKSYGIQSYNIFKMPPVSWSDITKDLWAQEWYYNGELLQFISSNHTVPLGDNAIPLTGSELSYFLQAATSNGVVFGYPIDKDYSSLYVKYSFN